MDYVKNGKYYPLDWRNFIIESVEKVSITHFNKRPERMSRDRRREYSEELAQICQSFDKNQGDKLLNIIWCLEKWSIRDLKTHKRKLGFCKTFYIYYYDKIYGFSSIRLCSYAPFTCDCHFNGYNALKKYCDEKGIKYESFKNSFEFLDLNERELRNFMLNMLHLGVLDNVICKWLDYIVPDISKYYKDLYFSQMEVTIDEIMDSHADACQGAFEWIYKNYPLLRGPRVALLLDDAKKRIVFTKKRQHSGPQFSPLMIVNEKPLLTFTSKGFQFKVYVKGKIIRFELTYNASYLKWAKINKKEISEIVNHAEKMFTKLALATVQIKVDKKYFLSEEESNSLKLLSGKPVDMKVLQWLQNHVYCEFKISELSNEALLSESQVYYRLRKGKGLVEHVGGRKWQVTVLGIRLISKYLEERGEIGGIVNRYISNNLPKVIGIPILQY